MTILNKIINPRNSIFNLIKWNASLIARNYSEGEGGSGSNPSGMYDRRKYGHNLPANDVPIPFEQIPNIPTGVFRCTVNECFRPGICKGGCYQNAEYFSFHHMTYFDINMLMRPYRKPSPQSGRKP